MDVKQTLEQQHTRANGQIDQRQLDWVMKNYKHVAVNGGVLQVCQSKPGIDSTIYYDDETDAPSTGFDNFRLYNLRNNNAPILSEVIKERPVIWIYTQYSNDKTGGKLRGWTAAREWEKPDHLPDLRQATTEEIQAIALGMLHTRRDFEKRLRTYFKRYNNKITTYGYYANR